MVGEGDQKAAAQAGATPDLRAAHQPARDAEHILGALEAGASGCVLKDAPLAALAAALNQVLRDGSVLTKALAARMLRRLSRSVETSHPRASIRSPGAS